ncbi:MAG: serine/threonine-protein phosphatase [Gammaproteobacteria bacterium]|nr:serine/threonine-protein phosphatase [Gammaproteobacteria bacterium]
MKFEIGKTNRLGNRNINQDRFAVIERQNTVLLLLADGMGGYKGGELAANTFVLKMTEAFSNASFPIIDTEKFFSKAFEFAHLSIIEMGKQHTPPIEPRSTGVACLIQNDIANWAHAGDSRLYLVRENRIHARTRDHSAVEELIKKGELTEKKRLSHPKLNQVTRCVGGMKKSVQISAGEKIQLLPDDLILLCSDGLWGSLSDDDMIYQLMINQTLTNRLDMMSQLAEKAAYPNSDNVSAVALRFISIDDDKPKPSDQEDYKPSPETTQADLVLDEIQEALEKINKNLNK